MLVRHMKGAERFSNQLMDLGINQTAHLVLTTAFTIAFELFVPLAEVSMFADITCPNGSASFASSRSESEPKKCCGSDHKQVASLVQVKCGRPSARKDYCVSQEASSDL